MSDTDSAVKIKKFSGKEEDWEFWSPLFLARADAKGYRAIIDGEVVAPNDATVIDTSTEAGKKRLKARQLNRTGYSELLTLCNNEKSKVAFYMVKKGRTGGLPNGCLKTATAERISPRTKHIAIKYHFFRSHVGPDSNITLTKIDTDIQKADIFTKGLPSERFRMLRRLLCGW